MSSSLSAPVLRMLDTPLRLSSWWMCAHRGTGRSDTATTGGGGNRRRSSSAASSSGGSGQGNPAAVNRRRYSPTVLRAIEQLRAIWRSESPQANLSRKTSLNLAHGQSLRRHPLPPPGWLGKSRGYSDNRCLSVGSNGGRIVRGNRLPHSGNPAKKWPGCYRIRWPTSSGMGGRDGTEYALRTSPGNHVTAKKEKAPFRGLRDSWQSQRGSNPCFRRERAVS